MTTKPRYDTKVVRITLSGYHREKIEAVLNAIGDADPENANIETKALKRGRVEIPHLEVGAAAANGLVDEFEIVATYDEDPLRTARLMGALVGAADILHSVDINTGRTFRW